MFVCLFIIYSMLFVKTNSLTGVQPNLPISPTMKRCSQNCTQLLSRHPDIPLVRFTSHQPKVCIIASPTPFKTAVVAAPIRSE